MQATDIAISIVASISLTAACGFEEDAGNMGEDVTDRGGGLVQIYYPMKLQRVNRTDAEAATRAHEIAEVILGRELDDSWTSGVAWGDEPNWTRPISSVPELSIYYDRQYDDLLVLDESLINSTPTFLQDIQDGLALGSNEALTELNGYKDTGIGTQAAWERYEASIAELAAREILHEADFDTNDAFLAEQVTGMGTDELEVQWVDQYKFYLNRTVKNIDIFEAGIHVGIHRDGRIASIRISDVHATKATNALLHPPKLRIVSVQEILSLVHSNLPPHCTERKVQREMVAYALPPDKDELVVYPRHVVLFSDVYMSSEGPMVSRRQMRGYSLTELGGSSINLGPTPDPQAQGDAR